MFATSPGNSELSTQSIGAATAQGGPTVASAAFDRVSLDGSWLGRTWAGEIIAASDAVVIRQAETFHQADGTITVTGSGDTRPPGQSGNPGATVESTSCRHVRRTHRRGSGGDHVHDRRVPAGPDPSSPSPPARGAGRSWPPRRL